MTKVEAFYAHLGWNLWVFQTICSKITLVHLLSMHKPIHFFCKKLNFDSLKKNNFFWKKFSKKISNFYFLNFGFWVIPSTQYCLGQWICLKNEVLEKGFEKTKKFKKLEKFSKKNFFLISSYGYKKMIYGFFAKF